MYHGVLRFVKEYGIEREGPLCRKSRRVSV